jgi:hypothetical protein
MMAIAICCNVLVGYGARGVDATTKLLVVLKSEGSFAIFIRVGSSMNLLPLSVSMQQKFG